MTQSRDNLIWIDLEMTGLDPANDRIIEIATIVTDAHLNVLAEGPVMAVHQSDALLNGMDEWNTEHHNNSGLVERVRKSDLDDAEAERRTLVFLEQYVEAGMSPMCGNSICQDRRFLANYMPRLEAFSTTATWMCPRSRNWRGAGSRTFCPASRRRISTWPWTTSASRSKSWPTTASI